MAIILIVLMIFIVRWAFGGTCSTWQKQYSQLCVERHQGKISIDEYISKSGQLWNKYHHY
jgi:hypothetical protein